MLSNLAKIKQQKKLRNKTQYNKMNEKYIILLYFGAAKLLFSRFVLQKFVLFSFLFWLYFSSFIWLVFSSSFYFHRSVVFNNI